MNISEKISQIRQEPEHIRLRWVWGSVVISMFFIIAIWIFSIGTLFQNEKKSPDQSAPEAASLTEQLKELKQEAPSIKDFNTEQTSVSSEGINTETNSQNTAAKNTESNNPQADSYSQLKTPTPSQ
jgi:hypothetical protein